MGSQHNRRWKIVTDCEKKLLKNIAIAIPKMTEFEKGYFLGVAETRAETPKDTPPISDAKQPA